MGIGDWAQSPIPIFNKINNNNMFKYIHKKIKESKFK